MPYLVVERLDGFQILGFQSHNHGTSEDQNFVGHPAHNGKSLLATLQHIVLAECVQAVAEHVDAEDAVPLREVFCRLRAGGLSKGRAATILVDVASEGVEHEDGGQVGAGFEEVRFHGGL
jgi:hypothetical protein